MVGMKSSALIAGIVSATVAGGWPMALAHTAPPRGCDRTRLGTALVVDTAALARKEWSGPSTQASEGSSVETWSDHSGVRVIRATYYGETGRTALRYYLLDPLNFVVEGEEVIYDAPLAIAQEPRVHARVPAVIYVCDGAPDVQGDSLRAKMWPTNLESLLTEARRH